jgi:ribosomal protein L7Ae-like RNA K-turn-binding protein
VRALLDLMSENEARVQLWAAACQELLGQARRQLKILDPAVGEKELIKAVAAAAAKLLALSRSVRVRCDGHLP